MTTVIDVFVDDMSPGEERFMPTLRRLARDGITFPHMRQSVPMCNPARASVMRGQRATGPHGHGVVDQTVSWSPSLRDDALPHWLQTAGVTTGQLGKHFRGDEAIPLSAGWDWMRSTHTADGVAHNAATGYHVWDGETIVGPFDEHQDRMLARLARGWLHDTHGEDRWLWLCTNSPHWPLQPSPRHQNAWRGVRWPLDEVEPTWTPDGAPSWVLDRAVPDAAAVRQMRGWQRARLRELSDVDDLLAQLRSTLVATGEWDDTLLLVWSDNGVSHLHHRSGLLSKGVVYDWAASCPLVAAGGVALGWGVPAGGTVDVPCETSDVTATVLDVFDGEATVPQDGVSLAAIAADPEAHAERATLVSVSGEFSGVGSPPGDAVVTRLDGTLWKFARWQEPDGGWVAETDEYELFDLDDDPLEVLNVAWDEQHDDTRAVLAARLDDLLGVE